jgi:lactoylglutathione lyase
MGYMIFIDIPLELYMKFLHSMIRVHNLDTTLEFFAVLGLKEVRRRDSERGRFTLVFLETDDKDDTAQIELTYNWDQSEPYDGGRNFGHLAFAVDNIYEICEKLQNHGITISRPPRDGRMAFVRTPDHISIELLQKGDALPIQKPWSELPNIGTW